MASQPDDSNDIELVHTLKSSFVAWVPGKLVRIRRGATSRNALSWSVTAGVVAGLVLAARSPSLESFLLLFGIGFVLAVPVSYVLRRIRRQGEAVIDWRNRTLSIGKAGKCRTIPFDKMQAIVFRREDMAPSYAKISMSVRCAGDEHVCLFDSRDIEGGGGVASSAESDQLQTMARDLADALKLDFIGQDR